MAICSNCGGYKHQYGKNCKECFEFDSVVDPKAKKIVSLVDKLPKQYSPEDALDQAVYNLKSNEGHHLAKANKLLIISLYDKDEEYNVDYISTELKFSEIIALLEIFKDKILTDMKR